MVFVITIEYYLTHKNFIHNKISISGRRWIVVYVVLKWLFNFSLLTLFNATSMVGFDPSVKKLYK